jgi:hypothetical protein
VRAGVCVALHFRPAKLDSVLLGFSRENLIASEPHFPPAMTDFCMLKLKFGSTFSAIKLTWFSEACCFNIFLVKWKQPQLGLFTLLLELVSKVSYSWMGIHTWCP